MAEQPKAKVAGIRINRYLSMCGMTSRRKADELVAAGKVSVNGLVRTDPGFTVRPGRDKVVVNGRQIVRTHDYLYLVMNKPKDTITTAKDEKGRTTVMDLVRQKQRVYPIGRLDRNTTGVLLLTNDGDFAHRLMHPKFQISKSYLVTCTEVVEREHLQQLAHGIRLPDGRTGPAELYSVPGSRGKEVGIVIREGRNRQVRRMFEHFGYDVKKLDRVAYGPVTKEGLARGGTRRLTPAELRELRTLAGMGEES